MLASPTACQERLPLEALHRSYDAKMMPFAGYEMPVSYGPGVLKEHLHTRASASLFDVSHMGQLLLRPRGHATMHDVAIALESLIPIDVVSLKVGRQRYGFFTLSSGGIRDDLMVANLGTYFLLVVNAICKVADESCLRDRIGNYAQVQSLADRVLLALQGPRAVEVLAALNPDIASMRFMDAAHHVIQGAACCVTRSGYTGEDGFEISAPVEAALGLSERLLTSPRVRLAGLGARDSLRLEAGLCLYGSDLDHSTTPAQAALDWAIPPSRRARGVRAGGFPGASIILPELQHGAPMRRVGLCAEKRPVRAPNALFIDEQSKTPVGHVTSGAFGPSLDAPIAMGYVPTELASFGTRFYADIRGQRLPVTVAALPFVAHRYKR